MELTEWQIVLLSTAVGSAIPLVLVVLREIYREKKWKANKECRDR